MKSFFSLKRIFMAFIFISHFLDLHKEQDKMAEVVIFFVTNFLYISPLAFNFQRSFCEKPLLKIRLCHVLRHVYTVK